MPRPASAWEAALLQDSQEPLDDCAYLWPENEPAWAVWVQCQTQWRTGMGGATGLDYAGVRALLDELDQPPGPERRQVFEGLRVLERATLDAWAESERQ